ncbi:unnamed protein product [Brassica rapa]|uniref:Uncharacterized protein n=1 Tax=Brassica campestris TaxID=3711 RepID=A0A8D9MBW0_BRACM|nr:unnamed protein product [Brassica rapa]
MMSYTNQIRRRAEEAGHLALYCSLTRQRKRSSYSNSSSTFAPNVLKVCRTLPSP